MEQSCEVEMGPGGVPKGAKTSDFYKTDGIPNRFDDPDVWKCYSQKMVHPMYRTTNSAYGGRPPSVHTMPTAFHAKSQKFSEHLGQCGMYRNGSMNTAMDKSGVPDH